MPADPSRWRALPPVAGVPVLLSDSVTVFDAADAAGAIIVSGSHGGTSAIGYVVRVGARGVLVNDAGVGKEEAGIAGLACADAAGLAVAAVAHDSARIGDAQDTLDHGRVSHVNRVAAAAGVRPDMDAPSAIAALTTAEPPPAETVQQESPPQPPVLVDPGPPAIYVVDSAVHVREALTGTIVVTGSHGGATHGRALDAAVAGAFFNDAGIGKDRAGIGRLVILEASSTPGLAVSHVSARIGDAADAWEHGVVSVVNTAAAALGIQPGQTVRHAAGVIQQASVEVQA